MFLLLVFLVTTAYACYPIPYTTPLATSTIGWANVGSTFAHINNGPKGTSCLTVQSNGMVIVDTCATSTLSLNWRAISVQGFPTGTVGLQHQGTGLCLTWSTQPSPVGSAVEWVVGACSLNNAQPFYYSGTKNPGTWAVYGYDIAVQIPTGTYSYGGIYCGLCCIDPYPQCPQGMFWNMAALPIPMCSNCSLTAVPAVGCANYVCNNPISTTCIPANGYNLTVSLETGQVTNPPCTFTPFPNCLDVITLCNNTHMMCNLCAAGYGSAGWLPNNSPNAHCVPCSLGVTWNDGTYFGQCQSCSDTTIIACDPGTYQLPCTSTSVAPSCGACQNASICLVESDSCTVGPYFDCTTCSPGYYSTDGVPCTVCPSVTNCATVNCTAPNNITCTSCTSGNRLVGTSCMPLSITGGSTGGGGAGCRGSCERQRRRVL